MIRRSAYDLTEKNRFFDFEQFARSEFRRPRRLRERIFVNSVTHRRHKFSRRMFPHNGPKSRRPAGIEKPIRGGFFLGFAEKIPSADLASGYCRNDPPRVTATTQTGR